MNEGWIQVVIVGLVTAAAMAAVAWAGYRDYQAKVADLLSQNPRRKRIVLP